ncbi:penicillin-binding protein [Litchfieldia alkalitelluris]|uniref:penicillin-binding protein n=1 Tax=Litchfieldia alkalitelluris TaxID=304268 RepID=UPI00099702A8|nr:penicillin-binding protein [Litchfieldia alkalitelluris]
MKMKIKNKNINRGAALVSLFFTLLFFILLTRFLYIQVTGEVDGQVLAALAEEKYTEKRVIEARRGTIYDKNGLSIAEDTAAYTVQAILDESLTIDPEKPRHVVDPIETARKIAPLLGMEVEEVEAILTKDKKQVEFGSKGRDISHSLKLEIEALGLPGIAFSRDYKRYYPNGTFASHVVGYAQKIYDEDDPTIVELKGQLGLEKSVNSFLVETDGYMTYQKDKSGFKLPKANEQITSPQNGNNIYLTLDQKIQTFLEDAMSKVVEEYEPEKIIGIVADPKTGEILAMGTRPSFDPNIRDISNYLNDAISYRFEPGSTMKIFTLAAAIEEGVYNNDDTFNSGSYPVKGGKPIQDHNKVGWGTISFLEGVQRSSNVGFAILANEKLGTDRLLQYLERFGLTEPTGIDLEGEADSLINYQWERDKLSTAFGQGSAITPIQQIQAATAIANGGKMMKPYIIDRIVDPDTNETIEDHESVLKGNPISEKTAKKVLEILETVVTSGTGTSYQIDGYQVAGKTGTAQITDPEGGYLEGHGNNVFSFLGMAPSNDPRLIVYIAVQQPKLKDIYQPGSEPVSKIFNPVMKNSLQYLNIQPKEQEKIQTVKENLGIKLDSFENRTIKEVITELKEKKAIPIILGNGKKVIAQSPLKENYVLPGERVFLKTEGEYNMPDVSGWSVRELNRLATLLNLNLSLKGNGFVSKQSIKVGATVINDDLLKVELKPPAGGNKAAPEDKDE